MKTAVLAALVFAGVLAVYASMLPAGVSVGDAAEAQTVPYILGIPHPTGFPAYVLAGWVFSHAIRFGSVAWRMNLFAATCTALSAAGVFLLAVTIGSNAAAALLAALTFAFGALVWLGAVDPNVQILSEVCGVYAVLASVAFARFGDARAFVAACLCCGIGMAAHPASIWVIPAVAVALAWRRRDTRAGTVALGTVALVLPLLLYAYLPLRSAFVAAHGLDPNMSAPLYGSGSLDWNTNDPRTISGFLNEVIGRRSHAGYEVARVFDPRASFAAVPWWIGYAQSQFSLWLLLLAAAGAAVLAWLDRRSFSIIAVVAVGSIAFASIHNRDTHLDRYLFVSFALTAALAAAFSRLELRPPFGTAVHAVAACLLAVVAGTAFLQNRPVLPSPHFPDGEAIIAAVVHDTPDNAIVVAQWNDAAALAYGAYVEHSLGSRLIVSGWPTQYARSYAAWSAVRPVTLYVSPLDLRAAAALGPFPVPLQLIRSAGHMGGSSVYRVMP